MQNEPQSPTRYAVFEDDPLDCNETNLSLPEAFHSIMAHCAYAPVWDVDGDNLRLRFRYLDNPFKGRFVGDMTIKSTSQNPDIERWYFGLSI
jgi:hypothetical protein